MPTFITLLRWTDQGIRNVKESPARADAAKKLFRSVGAELKELYLVTGRYDLVAILEAPTGEALMRGVLALGSFGNVRTETLTAFTEEEYRKIIATLP